MTEEQNKLWKKIHNFEMDDHDSDFPFTDRLVRENTWTMEYAVRVIEEYKKFIFLICISDQPMTPSDQVDQVWHLHLLYTQSYWIELCKNTINQEIHHGPTKGGVIEKNKYSKLYDETKQLYQKTFKIQPPIDIWPPSKIRFGELRFTRINRHRYWVIPKLKIRK